jgi:NitT/TauT family transport system ATP-binding protein
VRTIPIELLRPRSLASLTSAEFIAYKADIMKNIRVEIH